VWWKFHMCLCRAADLYLYLTSLMLVSLQLEFARSLADEFLTSAAEGLSAAASDPNTAAGWLEHRQAVRALAWRLEGAVSGLRSGFVDYDHGGALQASMLNCMSWAKDTPWQAGR
jgi:hypothetical protein